MTERGWIVSVNVSPGGVPKTPLPGGDELTPDGLARDRQAFEKHRKPQRVLSLLSVELLNEFQREGYKVGPGTMAENVTTFGIDLNSLKPGARLVFDGGACVEVSEQRRPCYQLNPMGEGLEKAAVGRCGVLCGVITPGYLKPGQGFSVDRAGEREAGQHPAAKQKEPANS